MDTIVPVIFAIFVAFILFRMTRKSRARKRADLIDAYQFPVKLREKIAETYPHLSEREIAKVIQGLREYFHICNTAGNKMVSMPSQVVDVAWHEFILFTKKYDQFCNQALGRFLHHTPAEAMSTPTMAQKGIKTAWRLSCAREQVPPKNPTRLPLLFALDAELGIPDGFTYALNCKRTDQSSGHPYCASHIGCSSGSSAGEGGDSDSGCSGGCGGD
ncbi:hypothetical protein IOQ59_19095 [Pontibacterium sp. N1Y112]|uniref:Uncharacterized protein n=1 Tax=Pontibacterium sinense TaxID=2781979 RepID=A0A8J7K0N2_9GAMM|nr:hypothetical protein [Pontibacterium sinense]MBE9399374.1 hypothetical protein [Pontibacterium sinense]